MSVLSIRNVHVKSSKNVPFFGSLPVTKEVLMISDISRDHRFQAHHVFMDSDAQIPLHFYMSIPIFYQHKVIGVLAVLDVHKHSSISMDLQLALTEIAQILSDMIVERNQGEFIFHEDSDQLPLEKRLLHLLRLPLRNLNGLQKQLQEFHTFLLQQKNGKNQPHASEAIQAEANQRIESFRSEINSRKENIERSIALAFETFPSLKEHYCQNFLSPPSTHRTHHVQHPLSPTSPADSGETRFLSVKDWVHCVSSYLSYTLKHPQTSLSPSSTSANIQWIYDEHEYLEVEEQNHFEIIGKFLEFVLLFSFHKWRNIVITVSVSNELPGHILKQKTKFMKTNEPFTDEMNLKACAQATGRVHLDVAYSNPIPAVTHLQEEFQFNHLCEEFFLHIVSFLHGRMTKNHNKFEEQRNIWFPCHVRERNSRHQQQQQALMANKNKTSKRVKTPYYQTRQPNALQMADGESDKTVPLDTPQTKSRPTSSVASPGSLSRPGSKQTKRRGKVGSIIFNDEDNDDVDDVRMIYSMDTEDDLYLGSTSTDIQFDHNHKHSQSHAHAASGSHRGGETEALGDFHVGLAHIKRGQSGLPALVPAAGAPSMRNITSPKSQKFTEQSLKHQPSQQPLNKGMSIRNAPAAASAMASSLLKYLPSNPAAQLSNIFAKQPQGSSRKPPPAVHPKKSSYKQNSHGFHLSQNNPSKPLLSFLSSMFGANGSHVTPPSTKAASRKKPAARAGATSLLGGRGHKQNKVVPVHRRN